MSLCPNCKTKLTCGCQRRAAKDGKVVCSSCVASYNNKLATTFNPQPTPVNHQAAPVINSVTLKK